MPRKRTPIPKPEELSADSGRFIQDLQQETDRGVALVGAAFLDDAVRALIRAALIKESETADRLFEYPRPLATFDARIDVAYCMGLIGKAMYQDLGLIRDIRNRFAHQHHPASFEEIELPQLCEQLQAARSIVNSVNFIVPDARGNFIFAVVLLTQRILLNGLATKHAITSSMA